MFRGKKKTTSLPLALLHFSLKHISSTATRTHTQLPDCRETERLALALVSFRTLHKANSPSRKRESEVTNEGLNKRNGNEDGGNPILVKEGGKNNKKKRIGEKMVGETKKLLNVIESLSLLQHTWDFTSESSTLRQAKERGMASWRIPLRRFPSWTHHCHTEGEKFVGIVLSILSRFAHLRRKSRKLTKKQRSEEVTRLFRTTQSTFP